MGIFILIFLVTSHVCPSKEPSSKARLLLWVGFKTHLWFLFLVLEKLKSLPFKKVAHQVTTMDAQPIIGVDNNQAVALMVTGQLKADEDPPHSFHHTFMLRPAGGAFVVSNEVFRLALH